MTPEEYLNRLRELLALGQYQEILELSREMGPEVHPQLSPRDLAQVTGILHGSVMTLDLDAAGSSPDTMDRIA